MWKAVTIKLLCEGGGGGLSNTDKLSAAMSFLPRKFRVGLVLNNQNH